MIEVDPRLQDHAIGLELQIVEVVHQVEDAAQRSWTDQEVILQAELDGRQVLGHLLDNAVKYSPPGGVISVAGRRSAGGVTLMVVDEGVGLPEGADIFEAFQRGDAGYVGDAPGIGLGLHIVRNLVEAMGGTVAAESDAGAGTRFTVSLPGDSGSASHEFESAYDTFARAADIGALKVVLSP